MNEAELKREKKRRYRKFISAKNLPQDDWQSMVMSQGMYRGYPMLGLKTLLLAVRNGELIQQKVHRRRNYMREYHKKYYREHKAKRSEYFRQRHIRKKHEKETKAV